MRHRPVTIRVRLALWYAAALLLLLSCVSATVYVFVRARLERALAAQLDRDVDTVATVLAAAPNGKGPNGHLPGDVLFMVTEGGRVVYHSDGWCRAKPCQGLNEEPASEEGVWRSRKGTIYRVKAVPLSQGGREFRATVAEDANATQDMLGALLRILLLSVPGVIALCVAGGYFLAGRALSPVGAMAAKAREITAESLSQRLPVGNPDDELGRVAVIFNETLGRLETSFARLRAFTANVSHELRTPLTAMRSVGEVALRRDLDVSQARDVIGSMLEEVDRLTRMVECMLTLARAEGGGVALRSADVDLVALAESAIDLVHVLAEERDQTVALAVGAPVVVRGDTTTLLQAVVNLLDNAIRYTPVSGHIRLSVRSVLGDAVVEVEDDGPGVAPEDRALIFERFYCANGDAGRGRRGTGLGLAIARSAVEAHGGRLEYEPLASGGSRFRIVLAG
jgi:heavy metal sensor kinase